MGNAEKIIYEKNWEFLWRALSLSNTYNYLINQFSSPTEDRKDSEQDFP